MPVSALFWVVEGGGSGGRGTSLLTHPSTYTNSSTYVLLTYPPTYLLVHLPTHPLTHLPNGASSHSLIYTPTSTHLHLHIYTPTSTHLYLLSHLRTRPSTRSLTNSFTHPFSFFFSQSLAIHSFIHQPIVRFHLDSGGVEEFVEASRALAE